jgi:hypothetical protein
MRRALPSPMDRNTIYRSFGLVSACLLTLSLGSVASASPAIGRRAGVPSRPTAYFDFNPAASGNLLPWPYFQPGTGAGGTTSSSPNGVYLNPGTVRVTASPLAQGVKVLEETTTPATGGSGLNSVAVYQAQQPWLGVAGVRDWIHFRVTFPAPGFVTHGATMGFDPWLLETHNDALVDKWSGSYDMVREAAEISMGVATSLAGYAQLCVRILGGRAWDPASYNQSWYYTRRPLRTNHAYDVLMYVKWGSTAQTGAFRIWIDGMELTRRRTTGYNLAWTGRTISDPRQPTLWQRPDGSYDHPNLELVNYHPGLASNSTVYFGRLKVGPTKASVRF